MLGTIFDTTLPVGELVLRGLVMYFGLLLLMRILGQREAGGLGITDVLLVVLVAEAAAPGLYGKAHRLGDALVLGVTILGSSTVVDAVGYLWPSAGRVLKASARMIVEDGKVNHRALRRELMTAEELGSILRLHGVEDIAVVKAARIEPNGMVSVLRRDGADDEAPEPPFTH